MSIFSYTHRALKYSPFRCDSKTGCSNIPWNSLMDDIQCEHTDWTVDDVACLSIGANQRNRFWWIDRSYCHPFRCDWLSHPNQLSIHYFRSFREDIFFIYHTHTHARTLLFRLPIYEVFTRTVFATFQAFLLCYIPSISWVLLWFRK